MAESYLFSLAPLTSSLSPFHHELNAGFREPAGDHGFLPERALQLRTARCRESQHLDPGLAQHRKTQFRTEAVQTLAGQSRDRHHRAVRGGRRKPTLDAVDLVEGDDAALGLHAEGGQDLPAHL